MKSISRFFCGLALIASLIILANQVQADPYTFWVNNNYDRSVYSSDDGTNIDDDVYQYSSAAFCPYKPSTPTPDCEYRNAAGQRVIPCKRDLQDFARLWVAGVTPGLIAQLPTNSTLTLSWSGVTSDPTIDLFAAADPGVGYQTNETVATKQIDPVQCPYIGRVSSANSLQFTKSTWPTNQFIWCGVKYGYGALNLTIADGNGNVLVQTPVYIALVDIKQMYERWTVGDQPQKAPLTNVELATEGTYGPAFQYTPSQDTNTPYILLVHGWNMETWEKDRWAECAFKRLYWQGYQGRFGSFRWPTHYDFSLTGKNNPLNDPRNFDDSESNAWASATGLLNKLNNLNSQYPGHVYLMAHSMGNVVAGEALRLAGNNQVVNTYVAMQGAIASHAYDPTTPTRSLGIEDSGTPNCYANYWTVGAPCYFNGINGASAFVNFYNTNDYALSLLLWQLDQNSKPDSPYGYNPYPGFFYRYYETTALNFPTNTYELFAYCDEARCYALGAQTGVKGAFTGSQTDLQSVWPSDPLKNQNFSSHFWHSAEFRSDYPQQVNFWRTILGRNGFSLK